MNKHEGRPPLVMDIPRREGAVLMAGVALLAMAAGLACIRMVSDRELATVGLVRGDAGAEVMRILQSDMEIFDRIVAEELPDESDLSLEMAAGWPEDASLMGPGTGSESRMTGEGSSRIGVFPTDLAGGYPAHASLQLERVSGLPVGDDIASIYGVLPIATVRHGVTLSQAGQEARPGSFSAPVSNRTAPAALLDIEAILPSSAPVWRPMASEDFFSFLPDLPGSHLPGS